MFSRRILAAVAAFSTAVLLSVTATAQGIDPNKRPPGKPPAAQAGRPAVKVLPPAPVQAQRPRPAPPQQQARRSSGNGGRNAAIGIGAAVIGGVILSEAARAERRRRGVVVVEEDYEDEDDRRQRCADRFRSFDWDDGTYVNRDGDRVLCPYLR
jgi:BA14K-like protein